MAQQVGEHVEDARLGLTTQSFRRSA